MVVGWYRHASEATLSAAELFQSGIEIGLVEVGPHAVGKEEFSIGGFPQQKIREALFTAGANQQIDFSAFRVQRLSEQGA